MRRGRVSDTTAETVAGDSLGDAVLTSVLSRIEDAHERTILFAHVALDLPVPAIARAFDLDPQAVKETVRALLRKLRSDQALSAQLRDIRRAGRPEHYLFLAEMLNLEDWLCARCGRPLVQPKVGRPRKTCSDSCRVALSLAGGQGWKDAKEGATSTPRRPSGAVSPDEERRRRASLVLTAQEAEEIRNLLRRIIGRSFTLYTTKDCKARDKALLLLGFTCPVQLSAEDLAALTLDNVRLTGKGLEIRLQWGRDKARIRQYVTVPPDRDPDLCPVRTIHEWQNALFKAGYRSGPLFPRMPHWDVVRAGLPGMGGRAMASVISNALDEARVTPRTLPALALLPTFLKDVAARKENMKAFRDGHLSGRR